MKRLITSILLLVATMAVSAAPEADPEDIIKYRKNVMKATGAHMSAADAIVKGKVPYKAQLADHARAIEEATKDIVALFPKDSDFGDTRARDAVWTKQDKFKKHAKDAAKNAHAFTKAVASGDAKAYGAKLKELSDACKECHKDFRKEEK